MTPKTALITGTDPHGFGIGGNQAPEAIEITEPKPLTPGGYLRGNGRPFRAEKKDRNAPCPCGSGKKTKRCCGDRTEYFKQVKPEELEKEKSLKDEN